MSNYDPSFCESEIERILGDALELFIGPDVRLMQQVECDCEGRRYRPDFVLKWGAQSVAIEADGREFHVNTDDDWWRDFQLIRCGHVESVVRSRGEDIFYRLHGCLLELAAIYPSALSERSIAVLKSAVRSEVGDVQMERQPSPRMRKLLAAGYRSREEVIRDNQKRWRGSEGAGR